MRVDEMDTILAQVSVMTEAAKKLLEVVEKGVCAKKSEDGLVLFVDEHNDPHFLNENDSAEPLKSVGEEPMCEKLGNTDFVVLYNEDDRVVVEGNTYLLGNYYICMDDGETWRGILDDEMDAFEMEFRCRLLPFVIGDQMLMGLQL